ncbi:hypothetical protein, partial [Pseudonocardia dioxanivorans]|uniref:hypothetical protein n=1 Tax=Pseudonocardia dioxanivorans TaxID=240495 RepID=UPI001A9D4418
GGEHDVVQAVGGDRGGAVELVVHYATTCALVGRGSSIPTPAAATMTWYSRPLQPARRTPAAPR